MDISPQQEWLVIVNPNSGSMKGLHDWPQISALLTQHGVSHRHFFTERAHHALEEIPRFLSEGYRNIIIVGGDGLLNEVVNGIFRQTVVDTREVTIAMIPVGTGNDWFRTFGIPMDYESAVMAIRANHTLMHDIGLVKFTEYGKEESRYFINMCGIGFDAEVAKKVNADRGRGQAGPLKYQYHLFTTLVGYSPTKIRITSDGKVHESEVFSMALGICKYNGGGMKQLPSAVPNDGVFDMTLIGKISRLKVMAHTKDLYTGNHVKLPEVKTLRGREILVESEPKAWIEVDGESLGHSPFRFTMLQEAVKVVVNS